MRLTTITFFIATLASVALSFTTQQLNLVQTHFSTLQSNLNAINVALAPFTKLGGSLVQAKTIGFAGVALVWSVETATGDVTVMPLADDSDASTVLTIAEALVPLAQEAVQGVVEKKPSFDQLMMTPLVKRGVTRLVGSLITFADVLVARCPPGTGARATALADQFKALWGQATDAYA